MLRRSRHALFRTNKGSGWQQPHLTNNSEDKTRAHTVDPNVVRRKGESMVNHAERVIKEHVLEWRNTDDKIFGGDHATSKAAAMNELKNFDTRLATPYHPELTANVLKCATFYSGPGNRKYSNDYMEGRIVGLCLASDTERSMNFLPYLKRFADEHPGDFVPVVISMGKEECEQIALSHGLFYLSSARGSMGVKRDLGHNTGRWLPLPRLVIVDGTTGFVITHSGYTATKVKPETCFQSWIEGDTGIEWKDYPLAWFG